MKRLLGITLLLGVVFSVNGQSQVPSWQQQRADRQLRRPVRQDMKQVRVTAWRVLSDKQLVAVPILANVTTFRNASGGSGREVVVVAFSRGNNRWEDCSYGILATTEVAPYGNLTGRLFSYRVRLPELGIVYFDL